MLSNKSPIVINPETFKDFIYSKNKHFKYFSDNYVDIELYGKLIGPEESDVRIYQNLLIYTYILKNLKPGSKILEIGNSESEVTRLLISKNYICSRLSYEVNNPETENSTVNWKLYNESRVEVDTDQTSQYDFGFSISEFNKIPESDIVFDLFYEKFSKLLKPLSYCLFTFVGAINKENLIWNNKFLNYLNNKNSNQHLSFQNYSILKEKDLFYLSKSYFENYWDLSQEMKYEDLGKLFSISALFQFNEIFRFNNSKEFSFPKKSHFELFNKTGYSEKLFGKKISESDYFIEKYKELLIYSIIINNINDGSIILSIGEFPIILRNALSGRYKIYTLTNPEILSERVLNSSESSSLNILNDEGNPINFFPLKFFDFIFTISEFDLLEDSLFIYSNIVTNIETFRKIFGNVFLCLNNIYFNDLLFKSGFSNFLNSIVRNTNKIENKYHLNKDNDLFSEIKNEFILSPGHKSTSVRIVGCSILWKSVPQLPIISSVRPNETLSKRPAYVFHHIMKCGGTSLVLTAYDWFNMIFDHTEDPLGLYRNLNEYMNYKINLENIFSDCCIVAHFQYDGYLLPQRYPEIILRSKEFRIFTFVRDPLDLMISLYYYGRKNITSTLEKYLNGQKNYMADFFPCNEENFKKVIDRYFFVGIVEKMQESFDKLADLTGNKKIQLPFTNKSEKDGQLLKLSKEFITKFKRNNSLDYKIYNYCLEKFNKLY